VDRSSSRIPERAAAEPIPEGAAAEPIPEGAAAEAKGASIVGRVAAAAEFKKTPIPAAPPDRGWLAIDSPCECEHNNPDSLDARLFPSVVLAVAPAVTTDEASSL